MAAAMQFDLVSPERMLASVEASAIDLPGSEGDMTVMPDHALVMSSLRPGLVRVQASDGSSLEFVVTGGFVEVKADSATVLAETAMARDQVDREVLETALKQAEGSAEGRTGGEKDIADKRIADLKALQSALGM